MAKITGNIKHKKPGNLLRGGRRRPQDLLKRIQVIEGDLDEIRKHLNQLVGEIFRATKITVDDRKAGLPNPEPPQIQAALSEAFDRGEHLAAKILRQPDMLNATDFATSLNLSRETVRQKTHNHEILALQGAKQGYRYPEWQVNPDGQLLPELPKLFELLGGNAWTVYRFLLQHHPELDGATALEALKSGKAQKVLTAARNAGLAFS